MRHHAAAGEGLAARLGSSGAGLQGSVAGAEEAVADHRVGVDRDERVPLAARHGAQTVVDRRTLARRRGKRAFQHLRAGSGGQGSRLIGAAIGDDEHDITGPALSDERRHGAGDDGRFVARRHEHQKPPLTAVAPPPAPWQQRRGGERRQMGRGQRAWCGDGDGRSAQHSPAEATARHVGDHCV